MSGTWVALSVVGSIGMCDGPSLVTSEQLAQQLKTSHLPAGYKRTAI